jgi:hypothetical protein
MVAGFIALLKVAVTTAVLGQTRVEASGGVTKVTLGGVRGSPGFPGPLSVAASGQKNRQQERQERRDPNFTNLQFTHSLLLFLFTQ